MSSIDGAIPTRTNTWGIDFRPVSSRIISRLAPTDAEVIECDAAQIPAALLYCGRPRSRKRRPVIFSVRIRTK
jgi:hypothetical protein